ncbi:hypothetical protein CDL15_Pgr002107 [Punica granatum]|uniref:ABC transporter B family member 29, chloroplastic n=1 Tax=Punica granatum TaxID=22663 RepID=A0A218XDX9_PUNGR|nr:hypothetical protein CDL15_Pgr002107 [Punica granatum]
MSSSLLISPHYKLHLKPHLNPTPTIEKFRPFHFCPPLNPKPLTPISSSLKPKPHALPFQSLEPYLLSQSKPILLGWLCSAISAFSLSKLVPKIGQFSSNLAHIELTTLRNEGPLLAALVAAKMVACYLQQAFLWEAALSAVFNLRVDVFGKVLERDLGFFEGGNGVSAGDIAYRVTAEAADVASTVFFLLNTIVPSTLRVSVMAMQMFAISPVLSLISAAVIPCMALVIAHLGERLRKISKKANLGIAALAAYLNEVLPAILFVKANNAELSERSRFQRLAHINLSNQLKKKKMKALIPQITQAIYLGALFIFCFGSLVVSSGSFDGSGMVSFITSLVLLIEPIQGIGQAYNELKQVEPAIERIYALGSYIPKVRQNPDAIPLDCVAGDVRFADVSFKYKDNTPLVLDRLNLHVRAGETVALVGPSGGGKTTLAKLLLRLYDPLSGTVAENIGYRDLMTHIDMERVELAGRLANADEFIRMLPEGYETNIGARGSILSGGQKQRLAIARAVYQDPSVLILDEATSALDSRSELLVRQALQRLTENRTVLVIAHRPETVMMADRVFHLNEGKLQELTRSFLMSSREDTSLSTGLVI